ncbi:TerD family protein [Nocardia sp. CDC159]|uniref:TerD family protein n=1 Tax=Nocardia pulmonis TaxID=2951408 RepID=A0A9X2E645_9NOCA|nr:MULTISPECIES: TerD family protein [Nocardia]MCM6773535.1 TerD family protein [Nocardia pulmonis]MCM6786422.1 TerD family protein [Nocardia sp. CDC159]
MRSDDDDGATPLPTSLLSVLLSWRSAQALDAHALLLGADGRVRSRHDAVFFNAPRHPSQAVTLDQRPEPRTARLSVSLPRTVPEVGCLLIAGSVPEGELAALARPTLTVLDAEGPVARCDIVAAPGARAAVFARIFRRDGRWWFRADGTGFPGAAELFAAFGVPRGVELARDEPAARIDDPTPPPADPRPDWQPDPDDAAALRWWDGARWTDSTIPRPPRDPRICVRCGRRRGWRVLGTPAPCRACAGEVERYLEGWRARAWRVLTATGPHGRAWDELWTALRYRRIDAETGRTALRGPGLAYVERLAAFVIADGEVGPDELDDFEATVAALALTGAQVEDLRRRLQRGRTLSRLRAGELPTVRAPGLHLDPEEAVHLDIPAIRVRQLARGPRPTEGRLVCSSRKLRFIGPEAGVELPWSRIVSVTADEHTVVVAATSARGGATFEVEDPDLVAAALEGALRVAKRLTLAPGRRDRRSIPPELKAQVWQRDGGRCVDCGATHYLEFDHVIPLSRGGATSAANLQILCRACNRAKGARI